MLVGQYETKISPKRRVAIPYRLRKDLGKGIIIASGTRVVLVMVGEAGWLSLSEKLTASSQFVTQPVRDTDRFILGSAFEIVPDAQGRVVLPESLTGYANMHSEVVFVGLGTRVEIWDKNEWMKRESYVSDNAAKFIETIAKESRD